MGIIGGGISGLYMAFEILKENPSNRVCIFEKDDEVGGRIRDHRFKEAPHIDVGKLESKNCTSQKHPDGMTMSCVT